MLNQYSNQTKINVLDYQNGKVVRIFMNTLNILGILFAIYAIYWGFHTQIFTNGEILRAYLERIGPIGPLVFVLIQIIQTVIPIIPGALTIPMGTMIFGMGYGFFLNFVGIMIGSILNFYLARKFGRPFVELLVGKKKLSKYMNWLEDKQRFDKIFTFSMFSPIAPDDFLCYLAGLSNISKNKYLWVLSLSKPLTLFIYSFGMNSLLTYFFHFFV